MTVRFLFENKKLIRLLNAQIILVMI